MKNPETVFRELGQLYDFQRELAKFRFRDKRKSNPAVASGQPVVRLPVLPGKRT